MLDFLKSVYSAINQGFYLRHVAGQYHDPDVLRYMLMGALGVDPTATPHPEAVEKEREGLAA